MILNFLKNRKRRKYLAELSAMRKAGDDLLSEEKKVQFDAILTDLANGQDPSEAIKLAGSAAGRGSCGIRYKGIVFPAVQNTYKFNAAYALRSALSNERGDKSPEPASGLSACFAFCQYPGIGNGNGSRQNRSRFTYPQQRFDL